LKEGIFGRGKKEGGSDLCQTSQREIDVEKKNGGGGGGNDILPKRGDPDAGLSDS